MGGAIERQVWGAGVAPQLKNTERPGAFVLVLHIHIFLLRHVSKMICVYSCPMGGVPLSKISKKDFGYFANFGREQTFEQSNWNFGTSNIFSYYYSIYIFITSFYRKWLWHGWQKISKFLTGVPPSGTSIGILTRIIFQILGELFLTNLYV
jgi:hypothetical protein